METEEPRRKRLRLPDYDYASYGAYFITIVTHERRLLFGEIRDAMALNQTGQVIERWWRKLPEKFEGAVEIDEFVVMPNHVHGIVRLTRGALATDGEGGGAAPPLRQTASPTGEGGGAAPPLRTSEISLPRVVQWFKAMTSSEFLRDAKARGAPMGAGRLWQRGYYEHVVRDDRDLDRIRQYIIDNPRMWAEDDENPNR